MVTTETRALFGHQTMGVFFCFFNLPVYSFVFLVKMAARHRPAATTMEFVLTSTTPGAPGLVSAEELSRISLEFATKVEEAKVLWDMLNTAPRELYLATEPPAEFSKAVEVMKQMAQSARAASQAVKKMVQESLSASQSVPKQPVDVSTDMEPVDVKSEPSTGEPSLESTSIFVGSIPRDWTDEKLQCFADVYLLAEGEGVARIIKRYHAKAKKGHAEIQIPKEHKFGDELDDGFELESKVTGLRFRVAKWQSKTPSHRVPAVATNRRKSEMAVKARQERKSEKSSPRAESEAVKQARKEQARFVADLLHAQAAPNVRRLYSQVISNTAEARMKSMETAINVVSNKVEARMKSMETAMYDVKQLLKRMSSREASTRATANPAAIHGGERV